MSHGNSSSPGAIRFLFENSVFLIAGAILALVWANVDSASHKAFFDTDLASLVTGGDAHAPDSSDHDDAAEDTLGHDQHKEGATAEHSEAEHGEAEHGEAEHGEAEHSEAEHGDEHGSEHGEGHSGAHGFTLHFLINDLLMALFFAIAGKEVWESLLPGGALSNPRKAATPLLATLGGIVGPAGLYVLGVMVFSDWAELGKGWAIPCATDIAFSYLVARIIFGNGHPAIAFLLLLAIADDAAGLIILAIFYPSGELQLTWLLATAGAVALGFVFRKLKLQSFWWYLLIPGSLSWFSFYMAGIHPALGLVPIIPTLPHAHTDLGLFAIKELDRHDPLNEFEHFFKYPVEIILGLFGLCNAAVAFSSVGTGTWLVLAGLLLGKPLGITLLTLIAEKVFGLQIPEGMGYKHVITLGCVAGIGFTVALFVSVAAFPEGGAALDSVKMGALLSFGAAVLSFVVAKALGVKPTTPEPEAASE
jgi:NhaA family Na+:H+ antiporter